MQYLYSRKTSSARATTLCIDNDINRLQKERYNFNHDIKSDIFNRASIMSSSTLFSLDYKTGEPIKPNEFISCITQPSINSENSSSEYTLNQFQDNIFLHTSHCSDLLRSNESESSSDSVMLNRLNTDSVLLDSDLENKDFSRYNSVSSYHSTVSSYSSEKASVSSKQNKNKYIFGTKNINIVPTKNDNNLEPIYHSEETFDSPIQSLVLDSFNLKENSQYQSLEALNELAKSLNSLELLPVCINNNQFSEEDLDLMNSIISTKNNGNSSPISINFSEISLYLDNKYSTRSHKYLSEKHGTTDHELEEYKSSENIYGTDFFKNQNIAVDDLLKISDQQNTFLSSNVKKPQQESSFELQYNNLDRDFCRRIVGPWYNLGSNKIYNENSSSCSEADTTGFNISSENWYPDKTSLLGRQPSPPITARCQYSSDLNIIRSSSILKSNTNSEIDLYQYSDSDKKLVQNCYLEDNIIYNEYNFSPNILKCKNFYKTNIDKESYDGDQESSINSRHSFENYFAQKDISKSNNLDPLLSQDYMSGNSELFSDTLKIKNCDHVSQRVGYNGLMEKNSVCLSENSIETFSDDKYYFNPDLCKNSDMVQSGNHFMEKIYNSDAFDYKLNYNGNFINIDKDSNKIHKNLIAPVKENLRGFRNLKQQVFEIGEDMNERDCLDNINLTGMAQSELKENINFDTLDLRTSTLMRLQTERCLPPNESVASELHINSEKLIQIKKGLYQEPNNVEKFRVTSDKKRSSISSKVSDLQHREVSHSEMSYHKDFSDSNRSSSEVFNLQKETSYELSNLNNYSLDLNTSNTENNYRETNQFINYNIDPNKSPNINFKRGNTKDTSSNIWTHDKLTKELLCQEPIVRQDSNRSDDGAYLIVTSTSKRNMFIENKNITDSLDSYNSKLDYEISSFTSLSKDNQDSHSNINITQDTEDLCNDNINKYHLNDFEEIKKFYSIPLDIVNNKYSESSEKDNLVICSNGTSNLSSRTERNLLCRSTRKDYDLTKDYIIDKESNDDNNILPINSLEFLHSESYSNHVSERAKSSYILSETDIYKVQNTSQSTDKSDLLYSKSRYSDWLISDKDSYFLENGSKYKKLYPKGTKGHCFTSSTASTRLLSINTGDSQTCQNKYCKKKCILSLSPSKTKNFNSTDEFPPKHIKNFDDNTESTKLFEIVDTISKGNNIEKSDINTRITMNLFNENRDIYASTSIGHNKSINGSNEKNIDSTLVKSINRQERESLNISRVIYPEVKLTSDNVLIHESDSFIDTSFDNSHKGKFEDIDRDCIQSSCLSDLKIIVENINQPNDLIEIVKDSDAIIKNQENRSSNQQYIDNIFETQVLDKEKSLNKHLISYNNYQPSFEPYPQHEYCEIKKIEANNLSSYQNIMNSSSTVKNDHPTYFEISKNYKENKTNDSRTAKTYSYPLHHNSEFIWNKRNISVNELNKDNNVMLFNRTSQNKISKEVYNNKSDKTHKYGLNKNIIDDTYNMECLNYIKTDGQRSMTRVNTHIYSIDQDQLDESDQYHAINNKEQSLHKNFLPKTNEIYNLVTSRSYICTKQCSNTRSKTHENSYDNRLDQSNVTTMDNMANITYNKKAKISIPGIDNSVYRNKLPVGMITSSTKIEDCQRRHSVKFNTNVRDSFIMPSNYVRRSLDLTYNFAPVQNNSTFGLLTENPPTSIPKYCYPISRNSVPFNDYNVTNSVQIGKNSNISCSRIRG